MKEPKINFKKYSLLLLVCTGLFLNKIQAQANAVSANETAARQFIAGANEKNYGKMRSVLSGPLKAIFTKKMLEQSYGFKREFMGQARIANITTTGSQLSLKLRYEKDTTETEELSLVFGKKNKIVGLGNRGLYQYTRLTDTSALTTDQVNVIGQKMDSLLQLKQRNGVFNGCVTIMDHDKVIYRQCTGYTRYADKTPLNEQSVFELASCSKQFTAMGIMLLAEQGKLKYSDDITQYIPELPYKGITIRHMLTHSSGLPDYMELLYQHFDKTKFATNDDIVSIMAKYKPKVLFKPGKKQEYSNTGYALLAVIIQKVSGLSYADFLNQNIFTPLGMKNSRVYNTRRWKNEVIKNYAYGYVYSDSLNKYMLPDSLPGFDHVRWLDPIVGDGTVNVSIEDLALWENALAHNRLVKKNTLKEAYTCSDTTKPRDFDAGYGVFIRGGDAKYEKVVYHSGGWPGYSTFILRLPEHRQSVVVLSNNEYVNVGRFVDTMVKTVRRQRSK